MCIDEAEVKYVEEDDSVSAEEYIVVVDEVWSFVSVVIED